MKYYARYDTKVKSYFRNIPAKASRISFGKKHTQIHATYFALKPTLMTPNFYLSHTERRQIFAHTRVKSRERALYTARHISESNRASA